MVNEKRVPDLLYLLESHAGDATPKILVVLTPPTPAPSSPPQTNPIDKKRKKDKKAGKGVIEEREIQAETPLEQTRGSKATQK